MKKESKKKEYNNSAEEVQKEEETMAGKDEQSGISVLLPCKKGDTVYLADTGAVEPETMTVADVQPFGRVIGDLLYNVCLHKVDNSSIIKYARFDDFGTRVFMYWDEAEAVTKKNLVHIIKRQHPSIKERVLECQRVADVKRVLDMYAPARSIEDKMWLLTELFDLEVLQVDDWTAAHRFEVLIGSVLNRTKLFGENGEEKKNTFDACPCKIGDTVYWLTCWYNGKNAPHKAVSGVWHVAEATVEEIIMNVQGMWLLLDGRVRLAVDSIGEEWFLTKEEADKVLKGRHEDK